MATEILRPQDCLTGRIGKSPSLFPRRKGCNYGNSYSNNNRTAPNPSSNPGPSQKHHSPPRSDHKRRPGHPERRRSGSDDGGRIGLAMEKVTILRRGSSLDSKIRGSSLKSPKDGAGTAAAAMYAGSAFVVSPEPSSLPLPSFSKKKTASFTDINDTATRNIRRMLQLD